MELNLILAAFGGGVLGAFMGGLPAFILCGIVGFAGFAMGGDMDILGAVAFGPFLGPHIVFGGGGVAAAAYAKSIGVMPEGTDILTPLAKFQNPKIYLVGGVAGILAHLFQYLYGTVLALPLDTVALSVVTMGILVRLTIGKTGITGTCPIDGKHARPFFPEKDTIPNLLLSGFAIGLLSSYYAVEYNAVTLGFCVSAASLMFTQMGFPLPSTHHITLSAAYAAAATGSVLVGGIFGLIAAIIGDFSNKTFNSYCDSHMDPPAMTISILSLISFTLLALI
ncbi:MAG: hypothetical protein Q4Q07_01875 [Tissierellia bacterium]|nr:hypothetical protein [Tissierellia bacterium]